jgi:exopolysaccharide biosynthesis protein
MRDKSNKGNKGNKGNSFFDNENENGAVPDVMEVSPKAKEMRKPKRIPVVWLIVIDVLIAALMLFVFALYYVILPRDMSQDMAELPRPSKNEAAVATPVPAVIDPEKEPAAPADTEAPEPTPMTDGTAWGAKFPGVFTDGEVVQTDSSYKSGNISVSIEKVQEDGITYYVADIYIKDIEYFRTAFGKENTFGYIDTTEEIARYVGGVIAINGDFCTKNKGVVVRDGVMYRDKMHRSDLLVLNYDGSMQTYAPEAFDVEKIKAEGVWQVWTFGPMLLVDGQPMESFNSSVTSVNPRSAVGYYEPGHYCFVVVDGRQKGYSKGMTMSELSQLFFDLGCTVAYNLDGGKSAEMAFMGERFSQPYEGGRSTSDILYIADDKGGY